MAVGGDRTNLRVRHGDRRIEGGGFEMLPMLLWTVMAEREREEQRIVALERAQSTQNTRVIRQFIVRENGSWYDIRTHRCTPSIKDLRPFAEAVCCSTALNQWSTCAATDRLDHSIGDACEVGRPTRDSPYSAWS